MANFNAHGRALRLGRVSESGRVYLVTTACHSRARLFELPEYAEIMMREFARQAAREGISSLAHVVMPDHVHWLVQLLSSPDLGRTVRSLKGRSARQINIMRNSAGPVWHCRG
jgi:REP element-mobilizing transposase RayT